MAATAAELALVVALAALWRLARHPASLLPAGAADGSENGADPSAWRGEQLLVLLGVCVIVAAGAALIVLLVMRPPGDGLPEAGFARDMIVHHAQAVEMAEIVRDRTEDEQVKILGTDIVLTQEAQIGQMQGWLDVWGLPATSMEPAMAWMGLPMEGRMPGIASPEEVNRLRDLLLEEADELFLRLLIEHHRAAIPMAEAVLEETDQPAVEELAGAIVSSQRAEIETMQKMLQDMGAPPSRMRSRCRWTLEGNSTEEATASEFGQRRGVGLRARRGSRSWSDADGRRPGDRALGPARARPPGEVRPGGIQVGHGGVRQRPSLAGLSAVAELGLGLWVALRQYGEE